jgi:hypothetical protein
LYCTPDMAGGNKSNLRRLVEDMPPAALVRVK